MATRRKTRKPRRSYRRPRSKMARVWTPQEISFLRKYYRFHDTSWVAKQLGRTVYSVRYKASDMNIRKSNPSNWKTPPKGVVFSANKPTRRRTYNRKPSRWTRTRRNNRRTKW